MRLMRCLVVFGLLWCLPVLAGHAKFEQARSWHFIDARGGLQVGQPIRESGQWLLPVACNVSGIEALGSRPVIIHNNLAWSKSVARVEGFLVFLTLYTALQGPRSPSAKCGPAEIPRLQSGTYEVLYLNPDGTTQQLGEIIINDC